MADTTTPHSGATRTNPFRIAGPAVISFSGGRTSAFMLYKVIEAHNGTLPPDVAVVFANTGREMPATLDFVADCARHFRTPIAWVEYCLDKNGKASFREVDYETASRNGEPYDALLSTKTLLPNPRARFCTTELKVRTIKKYILARYKWKKWVNVVGLRADEPKRVARALDTKKRNKERWAVACPLADAAIKRRDVEAFWAKQPFRLRLAGPWEGNCDGCFLKSRAALERMMVDHPERMAWWISKERPDLAHKQPGAVFHIARPSYAALREAARTRAPTAKQIAFADLMEADPECGNSCEPL